ncbi:hypothetical protein P691DRAFT_754915 [Macrolepiota fuliginosa MF-IS2]|uniref:Uncharacterized protein n=1 Tax=Macrolepiota fuliginosa MF-IS2 TaxID=1400762 RepID=A0A9P6CAI8_9AGAR|nr:hypothetical protein P691DRAFT_754915 [Macrolepiota fuliginosa MF-IS2]
MPVRGASVNYNEPIISLHEMHISRERRTVRVVTAHPTLAHWDRQESIKVVLERCSVLPTLQDTLNCTKTVSSVAVGEGIGARDSISLWNPNIPHFAESAAHITFRVIPNETPFGVQEEIPPGTLPFFVLMLAAKRAHDVLGKYELTGHNCFSWCRGVIEAAATFTGRPYLTRKESEEPPANISPLDTGLLTHPGGTLGKCYGVAAATIVTGDTIQRDIITPLREDIKRVGREKEEFCDKLYVHKKRAIARGKQVSRLEAVDGGEERGGFDVPVGGAGSSVLEAPPGGTQSGADGTTQKTTKDQEQGLEGVNSGGRQVAKRGPMSS